jgi:serine/threonine-protein kinase
MRTSATERFRRADAIFDAALDLADAERTAYVERACGDDAALRAEVLGLLGAHRSAGDLLDGALVPRAAGLSGIAGLAGGAASPDARPPGEPYDPIARLEGAPPARVGPFRIVREIGRGGMGRVFLAERADGQFEQRVAVKLMRHAWPGLVRRFLEERRIVARLEHPAIARVVDGGVDTDGLPYLALEYVEGEPIDRYCEARALSLDARLALFGDVCEAVSYAHEHLVIHRDLKPSNILVTPDGRVKLLDFGIAKLLDADGGGGDDTHTGFRAMTPDFAAPEQVRGAPVSTATDVYALGVLLYLLLAGERPYEARGKSPAEIERIVCEADPPPPSARAPAARRRRLRGDLDLVVMTALQKDERRRYRTPAALAGDVERFRTGRPLVARADGAAYRLRRFVGRHRAGVAAGAALVLALAGAASRERALRTRAEVAAEQAAEVERFLVGVFDVADPYAAGAPDGGAVTARELLDRGARRVDSGLAAQPAVQARLRTVLGRVYANLGLPDRATPLLRRALAQRAALPGAGGADAATTMELLGTTLAQQDRFDEAERLLGRAVAERRRLHGDRDTATARSLDRLATLLQERNQFARAEPLFREALAIRRAALGDTSPSVASSLNDLGLVLYERGAYDEAEAHYRRALDVYRSRPGEAQLRAAEALHNLGQVLSARRRRGEAEGYYRQSLAAKRRVLGDAHPSVTISLNNLSRFLAADSARLGEAEALAREAIAFDRRTFGARHTYVAEGMRNLGIVLRARGDLAGSERALREALAIDRVLLKEPHRKLAAIHAHLAQTVHETGDADEAIVLMRRALDQYRAVLGDGHTNTLVTTGYVGRMLAATGRAREAAEAERLLRAALARLDTARGEHRAPFVAARRALGEAVLAQGRAAEARPILEEALALARARFGAGSWQVAEAELTYGRALAADGRASEAAPLLRSSRATLARRRATQPRLAAAADLAARRAAP